MTMKECNNIQIVFISAICVLFLLSFPPLKSQIDEDDSQKVIVNYGTSPVVITITTPSGTEDITIPPNSEIPIPINATKIFRDANDAVNQGSINSPVQVICQGKRAELSSAPNSPPIILDPNRPEIMQPQAAPVKPGKANIATGDAVTSSQFTNLAGKTVVNYGSQPVEVDVVTSDGKSQSITVPPGQGVALPPGTTSVERDMNVAVNHASKNARVQVAGDGKEQDLTSQTNSGSVVLDPSRPEILKPESVPVGKPGLATASGEKTGSSQFTGQEGKTVVNYGNLPVEVDVTLADGNSRSITIPPGHGVALPAGVTKIERDMDSKVNHSSRDARVQIAGDGKEVDLSPESPDARLDPKNPSVLMPASQKISTGRKTYRPPVDEDPDPPDSPGQPKKTENGADSEDDEEDDVDVFAPSTKKIPQAAATPQTKPQEPKTIPAAGPDTFDGLYRGKAGEDPVTLKIQNGQAVFTLDKIQAKGSVTKEGKVTARWSGVIGSMQASQGTSKVDIEVKGELSFTGVVRENSANGQMTMAEKWPEQPPETETVSWSCSR